MEVVFDERIRDYMERKGYVAVVVEAVNPTGCCADSAELYTRFAKAPEAEKVKRRGCRVFSGEAGEVLLATRSLEHDDEIRLGLRSFLGAKDITVKGIRAWRL